MRPKLANLFWGLIWILTSLPSQAQTTSYVEKAKAEIQTIPHVQRQSSTDAQFSGILKLKDPRPQIVRRNWKYFLGFKLQSLQAQGKVANDVVGAFDLANTSPAAHPSVELGFSKPIDTETAFLNWGMVAQTGFSSEAFSYTFPSGFKTPNDTRLNTLTSAIGPRLDFAIPQISQLYFNTSARVGRISYTQTSLNDLAQFSEGGSFLSLGFGTSYNFYENWEVTGDFTNRRMLGASHLQIQFDNFELGVKAMW